jgi:hypothetical protein
MQRKRTREPGEMRLMTIGSALPAETAKVGGIAEIIARDAERHG